MNELLKLLRLANRAIAAGEDRAAVDVAVRRRSGGMGLKELTEAVRSQRVEPPEPLSMSNLLLSGAQGATLGGLDKIVGAMAASGLPGAPPAVGAPPPSVRFEEAAQPIREQSARFTEEHPTADLLARLYGGTIPGIVAGKALPTPVPAGGGDITRALAATGAGVGYGAAFGAAGGAASAESFEDVPGRAAAGAAGGAALGGGLSAALSLVGIGGGVMASRFLPGAVGKGLARQDLSNVVRRSGQDLHAIAKKFDVYASRRPNVIPADLDPQFGRLLREVINEGSGQIGPVVERVRSRVLAAGERIADDIVDLTGRTRTMDEARDLARSRLDELGDKIFGDLRSRYLALREMPGWDRWQNLFQTITEDPNVAPLWRKVRPRLASKDEPIGFGHLYALRREMGDEANAMRIGGRSEGARQLSQLRGQLTDILESAVPGFRAGNRQYAQTAAAVDAFDSGALAMRKGYDASRITRELAELQARGGGQFPAALDAYRHGMVDELLQRVQGYPRGRNVAAREFVALGKRRRGTLRAAFENEDQFTEMLLRADAENSMAELRNLVLGNSTTAQQASDVARSMRTAGFWSGLAAALNFLAKPNERIPEFRANALIGALATEGWPGIEEFFKLLQPNRLGQAASFAVRPDVTSAIVAPQASRLLDVLDRPRPLSALLQPR